MSTAPLSIVLANALPPSDSPDLKEALGSLSLPFLRRWLRGSSPLHTRRLPADSPVLPQEAAQAETLGWPWDDGHLPWAALAARDSPDVPQGGASVAWAFISLCHWQVGNGQFTLMDPGQVQPEESHAVLQSMRPYFEEDGIQLFAHRPGQWLAHSALFDGLPSASLDRVMGLPIEPWLIGARLPTLTPAVQRLRRLQNEMQMLLYHHPVNEAREARGQPTVNSFWLHGAGRPSPAVASDSVQCLDRLGRPARQGDLEAWQAAWAQLDREVLAPLVTATGPLTLTLCSDTAAHSYTRSLRPWWRRLLARADARAALHALLTP